MTKPRHSPLLGSTVERLQPFAFCRDGLKAAVSLMALRAMSTHSTSGDFDRGLGRLAGWLATSPVADHMVAHL
jgi:hypothetical protein